MQIFHADIGYDYRRQRRAEEFQCAFRILGDSNLMTCGLKTGRENASDIAVVIDDENVSQAEPRFAVQVPFYCSTGWQHQEPWHAVRLQIARLQSLKPLRSARRTFQKAARSWAIIAVCILHIELQHRRSFRRLLGEIHTWLRLQNSSAPSGFNRRRPSANKPKQS